VSLVAKIRQDAGRIFTKNKEEKADRYFCDHSLFLLFDEAAIYPIKKWKTSTQHDRTVNVLAAAHSG